MHCIQFNDLDKSDGSNIRLVLGFGSVTWRQNKFFSLDAVKFLESVTLFSSSWGSQRMSNQGFWNFARSRSREIQVYPRNPAKLTKTREIPRNSPEILPNTCRYNIFETYLGYWSCLLAVNLQIYLEILSLPRVNIVPKLPGVLRLMLRKPGDWPQDAIKKKTFRWHYTECERKLLFVVMQAHV